MLDSIRIENNYSKNNNLSIKIWRNSELDGNYNPYQMALSMSNKIVVTSDSISMMTECMAINDLKVNNGEESDLYIAFENKVTGKHARFLAENRPFFRAICNNNTLSAGGVGGQDTVPPSLGTT